MMPPIDESFHSIVAALKRLRRPAARLLQPGRSAAAIAEVAAGLPFKLTKELVELYRTTNGTDAKQGSTLEDLAFFPGYYLLSLEDAVTECRKMRRASYWKKGWFPFFANGAGDYYVVSCAPATRGVIGFLRGEPDQPVEYASVTAMFATLAKCFDEGAFYTKKREFEIDDDKHRHIAIALNPGVALWEQEAAEQAEAARDAEAAEMAVKATNLLLKKRNVLEALTLFEKALAVPDQQMFAYVNALNSVLVASEKGFRVEPARIRRLLDVCLAQKDLHGDGHLNAALCFILLGEPDRAIASLKLAKKKGVKLKEYVTDALFVPLATDKRFIALMK